MAGSWPGKSSSGPLHKTTRTVRDFPQWVPRKGVRSLVQRFFPCETHQHESVLVSRSLKGTRSRPSHQITQYKPKPLENLDAWIWDHYDKVDTEAKCFLNSFFFFKVLSCQGLPLTQADWKVVLKDGNSSDIHMLWINFLRHLWRVMLIWQYLNTHGPKSLSCVLLRLT